MGARTIATVVALVKDGSVAKGSSNTPHTDGDYIAAGTVVTANLGKVWLEVVNGTTAGTLSVRAPGNGHNVAGSTQTSPYPSNAVLAQGAKGDLTYSWGTVAGTQIVGPFTSDQFTQTDGNLYLDWTTATQVSFFAYQGPFNQV